MENNNLLYGLKGWLFFYTVVLFINSIFSILGFINAFSVGEFVMDGFVIAKIILLFFSLTSFILIIKKSPKAILFNKISLTLLIVIDICVMLYMGYPTKDYLGLLFSFVGVMQVMGIIITSIFLGYWFRSRRVRNTFLLAQQTNEFQNQVANSQNTIKDIDKIIFSSVIFLSCFMFIFTGFSALGLVPGSIIFSIIYIIIFIDLFNKHSVPRHIIYSVLFTTLFSYISILLNIGIFTDSTKVFYLIPGIMQIPGESFDGLFKTLLTFSFRYLIFSILLNVMNVIEIKGNIRKVLVILIPITAFVPILIHFYTIYKAAPQLKIEVAENRKKYEAKEIELKDKEYAYSPELITEKVVKNRLYSYFTPIEPKSVISTKDCAYLSEIFMDLIKNDPNGVYNYSCLNDYIKNIGEVPITSTQQLIINIPNQPTWLMKGDVLVFVAELSVDTYFWINAIGNIAIDDGPYRMTPYDYDGVVEVIDVSSTTKQYQKSLVQHNIDDRTRTVMVFYPINVDGLSSIRLKLSQFSRSIGNKVVLKELALFKPKYNEPLWLSNELKKPNLFLKK